MKYSFRSLVITLLVAFGMAIGGCKENTLISSKIAPSGGDVMVFGDSLPIFAKTVYDDSVVTSLNYSGLAIYQGIGTVNDPFFGKTNAATYFQVIPTTPNFKFDGFTIDSAVLVLPYGGYIWGDTNNTTATQNLVVYRMTESLDLSSTYYPYTQKAVDNGRPYSATTSINIYHLRDSVNILGVNRAPHARIRLNDNFINDITGADIGNFADNPTFINWFKGLCVMSADTNFAGNTLPYFRLDGSDAYTQANILFYYHTPGGNDTLTQSFPFSTQFCAHYNKITRNYSGSLAQPYINSATNTDVVLLQNQPGAAIDVVIPNISHIPQSVINRAELVISVAQPDDAFPPPTKVFAMGVARRSDGGDSIYYIADRYPLTSLAPIGVIDGFAKNVNGVTTYKINIPRELQAAITQKRDTLHLRIIGTQDYYGAARMIAGGSTYSDASKRIKFNVILTKLN